MAASNQNFLLSGSATITLSGSVVTTDLLLVGKNLPFSLECLQSATSGLDGTPTYTLKASNSNDASDLKDFDADFTTDLDFSIGVYSNDLSRYNYFAIEITPNDNTTGQTEFIINIG